MPASFFLQNRVALPLGWKDLRTCVAPSPTFSCTFSWRAFLFDIQRACQRISEFTSGMTFQDYAEDLRTRSAVERQLEIVGEAVGQVLKAFPDPAVLGVARAAPAKR